jgi:hypothetical protein
MLVDRLALAALLSLALACGDGKTGASDGSTGAATGDGTHGGSTTSAATDATTAATSTASTTSSTTDPTTGDLLGFNLFRIENAAGPCPGNADCDGFLELQGTGLLRIEKFGELDDPVQEFMVTPEELSAAVLVFADPELVALLDGPDPVCPPPTDVFESMLVELTDGAHEGTTTICDQPPVAAARDMATTLRDKYAP